MATRHVDNVPQVREKIVGTVMLDDDDGEDDGDDDDDEILR